MAASAKKKILVNIWKDLIGPLNGKVAEACLNRDAYLDKVLYAEARLIDKEIPKPNSKEAKTYLSQQLSLLERKPVNFALSAETVKAIDDACKRKNIPRDSFINRIIFLLLAADQPKYIKGMLGFDLNEYWNKVREDTYQDWTYLNLLEGSLSIVSEVVQDNAFWAVRKCIEAAIKDYTNSGMAESAPSRLLQMMITIKPKKRRIESKGFNCFLEDKFVEGHPDQKRWEDELDEIFEALDRTRNDAPYQKGKES